MVVLVTVIVFVVAYAGMALWMRKIERFTESEERALALGDRILKGEEVPADTEDLKVAQEAQEAALLEESDAALNEYARAA